MDKVSFTQQHQDQVVNDQWVLAMNRYSDILVCKKVLFTIKDEKHRVKLP